MTVNPFDAIRERLQAVLCDARYARTQLRRFRDAGRAADALDRVIAALTDEASETPAGWDSTETPPAAFGEINRERGEVVPGWTLDEILAREA